LVLSLVNSGRVPLWYRPWDGNQTDDGVYLADLTDLRQAILLPENALLIGDRKLCNAETMASFCRDRQRFLGAHPWTDTAKAVWRDTRQRLERGALAWTEVEYVSRNNAHKAPDQRPRYRVYEVPHILKDKLAPDGAHTLRWIFVWSSDKAEQDARQRHTALTQGAQALKRIKTLLGRDDYTKRETIEARVEKALQEAKARTYFTYTLTGTEEDQDWKLSYRQQSEVVAEKSEFDGMALLCTNAPAENLSASQAMVKYKEQVRVEQTIDFIKSPVHMRPLWLHSPKRIAGLTLLIMVAALLEHQVRRWIAKTGRLVRGLRPEGRDDPYPTAKTMLRAFQNYALVIVRRGNGRVKVHHPKLGPVQQQIWRIMELPPLPA
jgi:transposase